MDNKEFPQEEQKISEDVTEVSPETAEEAAPLIEELAFTPETPAEEAIAEALPISEEAPAQEESQVWEDDPVIEAEPQEPEAEEVPGAEEMPVIDPIPSDEAEPASEEIPSVLSQEEAPDPEVPSESEPVPQEEETQEEEAADQEYRDGGKDFDALLHAEPQKKAIPMRSHPPRKGRPKRKKGEGLLGIPSILVTVVWLALILAIGVTAGRMLWVCAADVLAFGREDKPVTITVYASDDMNAITNKLYDAGLIRYKGLFNLYASISDAEEDIKPGIYDLNTRYDYHALVNFMSPRSSREVIELTIPEGYTCRQIFALLEENRVCTAVDAAAWAANGELDDYWFLEGVERGTENSLEGFLFPDTYEFYKNSTPREALQRMLNNFETRFDEEMRAQIDTLNAELTGDYTIREIAIVASLIEKESAAPGESPRIAGVIYNRLFNWGDTPAYLNIDAAIVYAQDGDAETIDTNLDSPYNTYRNVGLTPGPIANPGLSSLKAALNPESHDYYYYVLNPSTGMHQFSATQAEHDGYIREFYGN